MRRIFRQAIFSVGLATLAVVSGCMRLSLKPKLAVAVNIAADANQNQPVAVDLVEVDDKDLAKEVGKMTAADWFSKREQIREDFPKPKSLSVISWEWVPGQVVPDIDIPMRRPPRAVILFAHYSTPGPHRATLDPAKPATLDLGEDEIKVTIAEKPKIPKSLAK